MDLTLTQAQQALKDRATAFSKAEAQPLWNRFESDGRLVMNLVNRAPIAGLLDGLCDGAANSDDLMTAVILIEELALGEVGLALIGAHQYLCRRAVQSLSPSPARTAILERLKNGGDLFHPALLWPQGDQFEQEPAATIKQGRLRAVSGGSLVCPETSSFIGIAILETDRGERKSAFYFAGETGDRFQFEPRSGLGLQASPIGKLKIEKQLDHGDVVIELDDEDRHADFWRCLMAERKILSAAALIGTTRAAFEYALDYSKERTTFGKPISQHQAVGLKLADMAIAVEAARLMIWRAAESEDGRLSQDLAEAAWMYAKEVSVEVAIDAVQVLGGHGYLKLHPVEKWLRDVQTLRLLF
jgi:alkylation response protein AidB-like acyl-CoA dehydrogenase